MPPATFIRTLRCSPLDFWLLPTASLKPQATKGLIAYVSKMIGPSRLSATHEKSSQRRQFYRMSRSALRTSARRCDPAPATILPGAWKLDAVHKTEWMKQRYTKSETLIWYFFQMVSNEEPSCAVEYVKFSQQLWAIWCYSKIDLGQVNIKWKPSNKRSSRYIKMLPDKLFNTLPRSQCEGWVTIRTWTKTEH